MLELIRRGSVLCRSWHVEEVFCVGVDTSKECCMLELIRRGSVLCRS